ncbi:MAG TPA: CdaR family protein, partial [Peptostreptococcaceae bacterium]|nr:CdaR family protein [Peptostreptococcaceae bacterium]
MINKLKHNTRIKIISLFSAIVLWLYVMTVVDPVIVQSYRDVSVSITNMEDIKSKNLSIYSNSDLSTDIYIKGRMSALKRIKKSDVYIYGQVNQPKDGKNIVDLKADLPNGATYQLNPQMVTIDLEKQISLNKKIEIKIEGKSSKEIGDIQTSKSTTLVQGPRSLVNKVDKVVGVLNVEDKTENLSYKINLKAVDKYGKEVKNVSVQDKSITVNATLLEAKQVPVNIKFDGNLPDGYILKEYNLSQQSIQIRGKEDVLAEIDVINTEPINLNSIDKDTNIDVNLQLPKGVLSNDKYISVKIDISKNISSTFEISKGNVSFINNNGNIDTSKNNLPDKIRITVSYSDEIENLNQNDIKLYVDLGDNSLGDNKYKINH